MRGEEFNTINKALYTAEDTGNASQATSSGPLQPRPETIARVHAILRSLGLDDNLNPIAPNAKTS
jgi:hypothetical protein